MGGKAQKNILLLLLWAPTDMGEKHCQVCPKRLVASQELVVTWLTKSKNIYFEGEKSIILEEQVKAHIESKLVSGNVKLMSNSEQQSVNSTLSNESYPNIFCDIHINVFDLRRRQSNETFFEIEWCLKSI